jgi:hypothetical protein
MYLANLKAPGLPDAGTVVLSRHPGDVSPMTLPIPHRGRVGF